MFKLECNGWNNERDSSYANSNGMENTNQEGFRSHMANPEHNGIQWGIIRVGITC